MLSFPLTLVSCLVAFGIRVSAGASPAVTQQEPIPQAELDAARWIEGRVAFPPNTPADERMFVIGRGRRFSNGAHHRAEVGSDGRFRVALEKRTRTGWLLIEARYAFLSASVQVPGGDSASAIVLEPSLGALIRGRCRVSPALASRTASLRGTPIELFAAIELDDSNEAHDRSATLDLELGFEFGAVMPGRALTIRLPEEHKLFAWTSLEPLAPGETRTIDLDVRSGVTLRGRVVDDEGTPIAGAFVFANRSDDGEPAMNRLRSGTRQTSGADGGFEFAGLRPGDWELSASSTGRLSVEARFEDLVDGVVRDDVRIVLSSGRSIRGTVTWPDGSPVVGAVIQWHSIGISTDGFSLGMFDALQNRAPVVASSEGTFVISALKDGPYRVQVSASRAVENQGSTSGAESRGEDLETAPLRLWHAIAPEVKPDSGELRLVMQRSATLAGRVLDDAGQPIRSFAIRASQPQPGADREESMPEITFDDPDGRFAIQDLWDGEWDLCVLSLHAAQSAPVRVVLPATQDPLEIRLLRSARVSGTVVDPNGRVVPHASIAFEPDRDPRSICPIAYESRHAAGADGRFDIEVPAGWTNIQGWGTEWARSDILHIITEPGGHLQDTVLALSRGGRIAGSVLDGSGQAASGCELTIDPQNGPGFWRASTDDGGRFESELLAPGTYTVNAYRRANQGEQPLFHSLRDLEVLNGETTEIVLGAPKVPGRIRVFGAVRAGGVPAPDIRVEASRLANNPSFESVTVQSGADGAFELTLDRHGWHMWTLRTPTTNILRRVWIPEQPEFALDFQLPLGGVFGRIVGPDGAPAAGIHVALEPDRDSADRTQTYTTGYKTTGADGAFEFDYLEPATYRVQAGNAGRQRSRLAAYGQAAREGIEVRDGEREPVELRMSKACILTGAIVYEDGTPGAGIEVFARDSNGALVDWDDLALTDDAGRFRIDGLSAGKLTVFARGVGYASRESALVALDPARVATVEMVLEHATRLYVAVEDSKGKNVSRVQVRVFDEQGRDCNVRVDEASPDDEFDGDLEATLPTGTYRVVARHRSGASATGTVVLTGGEPAVEIELRLSP